MPMDRCSIVTTGSSPRVWGRRIQHRLRGGAQWRFIPTRVGQTCQTPKKTALPKRFIPTRVGQTAKVSPVPPVTIGSSPRVWGRPSWSSTRPGAAPVHPHACGADADLHSLRWPQTRFIPTRVGQTWIAFHLREPRSVHPHACGADLFMWSAIAVWPRFIPTRVGQTVGRLGRAVFSDGSSPRVWGRHIVNTGV